MSTTKYENKVRSTIQRMLRPMSFVPVTAAVILVITWAATLLSLAPSVVPTVVGGLLAVALGWLVLSVWRRRVERYEMRTRISERPIGRYGFHIGYGDIERLEGELCMMSLRKELALSEEAEIASEYEVESPHLSHKFDLRISDAGKEYLVELKGRPIMPSDIVNLSKLASLVEREAPRFAQLIICTPYAPTEFVRRISEQFGIKILKT